MVIGLVGDGWLNPEHKILVKEKVSALVVRAKKKHFGGFIFWGSGDTINTVRELDFNNFWINSRIEVLPELCDYVIIISNEQQHSEFDKLRSMKVARLELNYLSPNRKEVWCDL